jgi:hypothetical protein
MKCKNCHLFGKCRQLRAAAKEHFNWSFHNLIGHPLSEIFFIFGAERLSNWMHDVSIPKQYKQGRG